MSDRPSPAFRREYALTVLTEHVESRRRLLAEVAREEREITRLTAVIRDAGLLSDAEIDGVIAGPRGA